MNKDYVLKVLEEIIAVDSPTGYTFTLMEKLGEMVDEIGYDWELNNKGNMIIDVPGESDEKTLGIAAHADTLGLMVRSIQDNGRLKFTRIGGPVVPSLDAEYCKIYTRCGKVYSGTIMSESPAKHVHLDSDTRERSPETMEVVLDEVVETKEDTEKLGIQAGDFICYDPKFEVTESGYIKSRFLDDKLAVAKLLGILKKLKEDNTKPAYHTKIFFTSYEEVGHGLAHLPEDVTELLAVDMGCVGLDLEGDERKISICAKDSSGPYDYKMTSTLIDLCKEHDLAYAVDIYPAYGSDASAALKGGNNIKAALMGAGVANSHGMERSHVDGMMDAMKLVYEYMLLK